MATNTTKCTSSWPRNTVKWLVSWSAPSRARNPNLIIVDKSAAKVLMSHQST